MDKKYSSLIHYVSRKFLQQSYLIHAQNPVAIFANGIGDHLLTLPALRALATIFSNRLVLICLPEAKQNFFSDVHLRATYEIKMYKLPEGRIFNVEDAMEALSGCDLLLSLNPWHTTAIDQLLEYASSAVSIGFFSEFQIVVKTDHSKHAIDMAFDIPQQLAPSLQLADFSGPPVFPSQSMYWATMMRNSVPSDLQVMVVHAETIEEKMWPLDRFGCLLNIFLERHPGFMIFVVGEHLPPIDIARASQHIVSLSGLPLPFCLALVSKADLFLGIDSCMLHVADFFRVPGVGLFGPTKYREFGFRFSRHRHVYSNGEMDHIQVEEVCDALESLLAEITAY